MTISTTYPGVYVQEIPSGLRTITGVATSITAFLGRARRGPANTARTMTSFADFERTFGGLWRASTMSFAVRDFFANGGSQAIIVRLTNDAPAAQVAAGTLTLTAASPGTWGNNLKVSITSDVSAEVAARLGVPPANLFRIIVREVQPVDNRETAREVFDNLTVTAGPRNVRDVLIAQSQLLRVADPLPDARPADLPETALAGGGDGEALTTADYIGDDNNPLESNHQGLWALDGADLFNLLCIPPPTFDQDTPKEIYSAALGYCVDRRAILVVDPPAAMTIDNASAQVDGLGLAGPDARNAAVYFPLIRASDPTAEFRQATFVPCGTVAGVIARTDAARGVWKAPAGIDAALNGTSDLTKRLTDAENGRLNPLGINCLRQFPVINRVIWGARTMRGADLLADEYKYLPVRRLALFIEESLFRGTQWVVFEPNDEPLWAQIRLNVGAFMQNLFRQGAFEGKSPRDAYLVKCDGETTTANDRNLGRVNILVAFAPLRPAEFVILQIQQIARAEA